MAKKTTRRFEGTCWKCPADQNRVTGNGTDRPWRHDKAPADKHHASLSGTLAQI